MGKFHRWKVAKESCKFPQGEAEIESVLDDNFTLLKATYQGEKETFFVDSSLGKQQDQALEGMLPCEKH